MTPDTVASLVREMALLTAEIALPPLGAGLAVGLVVAIFQAATQVQESALGFVPKVGAMAAALVVLAPWLLDRLLSFTVQLLQSIAHMGPGGGV